MTQFTDAELDKMISFFQEYLDFGESRISEGLEQQKVIEGILETLKEHYGEEGNDIENIEQYQSAVKAFQETIDDYLDNRYLFSSIIEKCKELKSNN
jgi:hypothetical protein